MEVKIGVQNANRELVIDSDQEGDDVEKLVREGIEQGVLTLTDSKGRTVNFTNTVIIMTSNVGSGLLQKNDKIGFSVTHTKDDGHADMRDKLMAELQRSFRPEFLNRIDDIMVFSRLQKESLHKIVELQLGYLRKRLEEKKITIDVTESAKELLLVDGYDEQFGARPLKRAIQSLIQDPLALKLLDGEIGEGDTVTVEREDGEDRMRFAVKKAVKEEEVIHA